jgi:hypothetical protein
LSYDGYCWGIKGKCYLSYDFFKVGAISDKIKELTTIDINLDQYLQNMKLK